MTAAVQISHLWKFFGDYPAVRDLSLAALPGRCLALLGRNGAGKTTLLRMIAGLSQPSRGNATVFGNNVRHPATRRRIGVLGHGIGVWDELSAEDNLTLFAQLYEVPNPRSAAVQWLDRVGLSTVRSGLAREFSRGMRQRLAIARVFLHQPQVLLLDEPFTSLDDRAIALLQELLRAGIDEGKTVIMSTHQLREALELATDVALITRGRLAYTGERTSDMLADPGWLYRNYGDQS